MDIPAKDQAHDERQVGDIARSLCRLDRRHAEVSKGRGEEEVHDDKEEHQASSLVDSVGDLRVLVEASGVVPSQEERNRRDQGPG